MTGTKAYAWIQTVTVEDLPETFLLHPAVTVVDPAVFLQQLQVDASPDSPRAVCGAVRADIEQVYLIVNGNLPW